MKKGQLFIITVVTIGFILSGLINLTYTLQIGSEISYSSVSPVLTMRRNAEKEVIHVTDLSPYNTTRLNQAISRMKGSSSARGVNLTINWNNASVGNCHVWLDKAMEPMNSSGAARIFNITVHDPGEDRLNSTLKICWS